MTINETTQGTKAPVKRNRFKNSLILETNKKTGKKTAYTTVSNFVEHNPFYKAETIKNYITRKGQPFEDHRITIERVFYIDDIT